MYRHFRFGFIYQVHNYRGKNTCRWLQNHQVPTFPSVIAEYPVVVFVAAANRSWSHWKNQIFIRKNEEYKGVDLTLNIKGARFSVFNESFYICTVCLVAHMGLMAYMRRGWLIIDKLLLRTLEEGVGVGGGCVPTVKWQLKEVGSHIAEGAQRRRPASNTTVTQKPHTVTFTVHKVWDSVKSISCSRCATHDMLYHQHMTLKEETQVFQKPLFDFLIQEKKDGELETRRSWRTCEHVNPFLQVTRRHRLQKSNKVVHMDGPVINLQPHLHPHTWL